MEVAEVLTLAGATIVVTILTEVTKRAGKMDDDQVSRFGPLIACLYGVVIVVAASLSQGVDPVAGALTGLLAGAGASGIYSYTKPFVRGA